VKGVRNVFKATPRKGVAQLTLLSETVVYSPLRKEQYLMWSWIGKAILWKIISAIWRTVFKKVV
jgi:hypothetical protein